jgi:hypothetical protein
MILAVWAWGLLLPADAAGPTIGGRSHARWLVGFPSVQLTSSVGERISGFQVEIRCGRFIAINNIPFDWSANVTTPLSTVSTLRMEAGHGTSWLSTSDELQNAVAIERPADRCFNLTASVTLRYYVKDTVHTRVIRFPYSTLALSAVDASHSGR